MYVSFIVYKGKVFYKIIYGNTGIVKKKEY